MLAGLLDPAHSLNHTRPKKGILYESALPATALAEVYRAKVVDLQAALADPASSTEAIEILRTLIERVIVRPTAEKGFELELVGELAAMVELGLDSKKPASGEAGVLGLCRSSVKVVAGTRNHRQLTLRCSI